jgi:aminoglycoside phosphotransferase family enzyme/predicted kinase
MELTRLIELLAAPSAYHYPVRDVEVHQTHISAVFLAGPFAYKIKKPVNPGFLDFSTLDQRRHFCDEEVRLNRRLAPHVYLGVVPIVQLPTGAIQVEAEGEVVEWAVKMQRLPESATFLERLRRGEITVAHVEALARKIAAFHEQAETNARIAAFGRFDAVARIILDIYDLARPQVGATVIPAVFDRLRALAETTLAHRRPLIEARAGRGLTRDCHGDLHLDHVYLFPNGTSPLTPPSPPEEGEGEKKTTLCPAGGEGRVRGAADMVIIDCIEFNERFRCIDPIADMAFPFMDFTFWGRRDLARAFASAYFRASGDEEGRTLLPLYTAYRATVRGAVEGLLLNEKEVPEAERAAALVRSRAHWRLALAELEEPSRRPCLVLVAGLPGSGKSVLGRGLAQQAGFCTIRSDLVRKELAGLPTQEPAPHELRERLYSAEWDERTYAECLRRAESLLFEGKRVLVDATFREELQRTSYLEAAARWGVPGVLLLCHAEPQTVRRRLAARRADASDADWSVYQIVAKRWEEPGLLTQQALHAISTDDAPEQVLAGALEVLRKLCLHT